MLESVLRNMRLSISTRPDLMGTGTLACRIPGIPLQIPPTWAYMELNQYYIASGAGGKQTTSIHIVFFHSAISESWPWSWSALTNDCGDWKFREHICCRLKTILLPSQIPRKLQTDNVLLHSLHHRPIVFSFRRVSATATVRGAAAIHGSESGPGHSVDVQNK